MEEIQELSLAILILLNLKKSLIPPLLQVTGEDKPHVCGCHAQKM
jgi:hypothetical protein